MTTQVTQTNGNILANINDFSQNTKACSLTLSGRGSMNEGSVIQNNIIRILENFAYPTSPQNPLVGQLWYKPYILNTDSSKTKIAKLYMYIADLTVTTDGWIAIADQRDIDNLQDQINNLINELEDIEGKYLPLTGGSLSGPLGVTDSIVVHGNGSVINISTDNSSNGSGLALQTNGSNRWYVGTNGDPEDGTNGRVGSNFEIMSYDNGNNEIETPLVINRSTGMVTLKNLTTNNIVTTELAADTVQVATKLTAPTMPSGTSTTDVATTAFVYSVQQKMHGYIIAQSSYSLNFTPSAETGGNPVVVSAEGITQTSTSGIDYASESIKYNTGKYVTGSHTSGWNFYDSGLTVDNYTPAAQFWSYGAPFDYTLNENTKTIMIEGASGGAGGAGAPYPTLGQLTGDGSFSSINSVTRTIVSSSNPTSSQSYIGNVFSFGSGGGGGCYFNFTMTVDQFDSFFGSVNGNRVMTIMIGSGGAGGEGNNTYTWGSSDLKIIGDTTTGRWQGYSGGWTGIFNYTTKTPFILTGQPYGGPALPGWDQTSGLALSRGDGGAGYTILPESKYVISSTYVSGGQSERPTGLSWGTGGRYLNYGGGGCSAVGSGGETAGEAGNEYANNDSGKNGTGYGSGGGSGRAQAYYTGTWPNITWITPVNGLITGNSGVTHLADSQGGPGAHGFIKITEYA